MDRRQRKSREAIFDAFTELLSKKDFAHITVGQIIEKADVGRATFYAHFETKEYLLKEFCRELFCHIFDSVNGTQHRHIFHCDGEDSVFLHLFQHLYKNDRNILALLSGQNNSLFMEYFRVELIQLVKQQLPMFEDRRKEGIPADFWQEYITSTFVSTLKWWLGNGMTEPPEVITEYFLRII